MAAVKTKKSIAPRFQRRNLKVLQQAMPEVAAGLPDVSGPDGANAARILTAQSGKPTAQWQTDAGAIHLHSAYDPVAEAGVWTAQAEEPDWQIGIVFGFGLGYHVQELMRRFPKRRFVVIEPQPELFASGLHVRDLRTILRNPNLRVMLVHEPDARLVASLLFDYLRKHLDQFELGFFGWPPYVRRMPDLWTQVQKHLGEQSRQELINLGTYGQFSIEWEKNCLHNLRISAQDPSVTALQPLFQEKPALLVSSGPSLEKNLHLLAEAKDKALIVAVGSAIEVLSRHQIQPDLVVSFDAGADNFFPFARLDTADIPLVYSNIIYPLVLTEYAGPRFVMGVDVYPYERWLYSQLNEDRGQVRSGPSTANVAWDLLLQLGCDPIVFVGQDLALTDNRTHADGVSAAHAVEAQVEQQSPDYDVIEDIHGKPVLTTKVMHSMKIWFEQRIRLEPERTFIDATEGGARIRGTDVATLRETLDRYCTEAFQPSRLIAQAHQQELDRLGQLNLPARVPRLVARVDGELARIDELCQQAVEPLQTLAQANESGRFTAALHDRLLQTFARLDGEINQLECYREFVLPAITQYLVAFDKLSSALQNETNLAARGLQMAELYAGFFGTVRKTCQEIRQLVAAAQEEQTRYSRQTLYAELDEIDEIAVQAQQISQRLQAQAAAGPVTGEAFAQAAAQFHQIDARLRGLEAYWGFIRRMLQRHSSFGLEIGMSTLYKRVQAVDGVQTLDEKAAALAALYQTLVASLDESAACLRELVG